MYLRFYHATAKIQDCGNPAGEAPKLLLAIPASAGRLDDRVQWLLVRMRLNVNHLWRPGPNGLAADEELYGGVAYLAFRVSPVPDADQGVAVAPR